MKKICLIFYLFSISAYCQVGIGTNTPKATLHVNGNFQLTNEFNVGGTSTTAGESGISGYILTSQGSGNAPSWVAPTASTLGLTIPLNLVSTGSSSSSTSSFQSIPGLTTSYVATQTGKLILRGAIYGQIDNPGGDTYNTLQFGISVNSSYIAYGGIVMVGNLNAGRNPASGTFITSIDVIKGTTYTIAVNAKTIYSSTSTNSYAGRISFGNNGTTYYAYSYLQGLLVPTI